ncbi:H/ACA ribonucleoprotein complex subunit 2-like protein [Apostichopus japonicus]|uniref:H/ACA ribonucleoprotein complex subunit 2-like protein n=1 Tax=Stichopus japonicus TaxID=307972 RepID=UPI003AB29765
MTKTEDQSMEVEEPTTSYEELVSRVSPIANPLASRKLTKKLYKTIKKAHKAKNLRRGVIDVQKFIRKGESGFVVFAGDVTPIEVMCHLPAVCEEKDIPYCYVPSKEELGTALDVKRTVCCVLVKESDDYKEHYDECFKQLKSLPPPI